MASAFKKANIVGGGFQDPSGNPLSNGWLVLRLSHDSNITVLGAPNGSQVAAGVAINLYLDTNGNLVANQYLWTNDSLSPSGSYYLLTAYNSNGVQVSAFPQTYFIQPYAVSINIGTLQPNTP